MEESEASTSNRSQPEEVVEAGGVFWLNAVNGACGAGTCGEGFRGAGTCGEGFQLARRTVKPDGYWRTQPESEVIPVKNKFSALQEVSDGGYVEGKMTIDSGAADSVLPKETLEGLVPMLPKKEGVRFCAADGQTNANYGRRNVAFQAKGRGDYLHDVPRHGRQGTFG